MLVVEARRMNMPIQDSALGDTFALERVSIRAGVPGIIEERHVEAGVIVRKGQLLFVIGEKPFHAQLDAEKSALADAKAGFEIATIECDPKLDAARTTVAVARAPRPGGRDQPGPLPSAFADRRPCRSSEGSAW